jgi:hypothetical protein
MAVVPGAVVLILGESGRTEQQTLGRVEVINRSRAVLRGYIIASRVEGMAGEAPPTTDLGAEVVLRQHTASSRGRWKHKLSCAGAWNGVMPRAIVGPWVGEYASALMVGGESSA